MTEARARFKALVFNSPDPLALARFYTELLGWEIVENEGPGVGGPDEDRWVRIEPPFFGTGLSFQYKADHQPMENVRAMLDPDGNPFCLFRGQVISSD